MQVRPKECDGTLQRERCCRGIVDRGAVGAVEAVIGRVNVKDALRIRRSNRVDVSRWNVGVTFAEMEHRRTPRRFGKQVRQPPAVIGNGGGERQPCRGEIGDTAAPAESGDTDTSSHGSGLRGCRDVAQRAVDRQAAGDGETCRRIRVRQDLVGVITIEQRRGDRQESGGGVLVGDRPDMVGQTEDLLNDDDPPEGLPAGARPIGAEAVAVGSREGEGVLKG